MKIRKGFVSNSSTTSFCIYGVCASFDDIEKSIFDKYKEDENNRIEKTYQICDENNLFFIRRFDCDDSDCYIGRHIADMKDEETLGEFKNKTKELMKKLFGGVFQDDKYYSIQTDGWADN
ncbi:hypothetical protein M0R19_03955 [Candidatus Pacearchaeota archaeon]|nr:hypothetical protein [Candidatus Pacearchaeota archaeon]